MDSNKDFRALMRKTRKISLDFGHHEIIMPIHLLAAVLKLDPPRPSYIVEQHWQLIAKAIKEIAPPWDPEMVVLSPGGQTPSAKRVLETAMLQAGMQNEPVGAKHLWDALMKHEGELVESVLSRLCTV